MTAKPKVLVSLVGHQPLPNLMAIRHENPDRIVLLASESKEIIQRRHNLIDLLAEDVKKDGAKVLEVIETPTIDAWDMTSLPARLERTLRKNQLLDNNLIFDATGGTKAMSISLTQAAQRYNAALIYVVSERPDTYIWRYHFTPEQANQLSSLTLSACNPLPPLVTIRDLIYAYLGHDELEGRSKDETNQDGYWFEHDVARGFKPLVAECKHKTWISSKEEVDIILRIKNRFAIVECKTSNKSSMVGIHQLNTAASERYLGTYTGKILAVTTHYEDDIATIAREHRVHILRLPEWRRTDVTGHQWSTQAQQEFADAIKTVFG